MLKTIGTQMTIADYCEEFGAEKIYVNKNYQRSDKRWSSPARSFLIETILLGYPLPKFYLYPITDVKNRRTLKEIVDGQQRTSAITDFFEGQLKLSNQFEITELREKTYAELPPNMQEAFLAYPLSIDLFTDVARSDIFEVFRRMNSNSVTLTPEEIRHAQFQGKFKWFVYHKARDFETILSELETFGPRQFIKMLDLRWVTELLDSFVHGIRTTKATGLKAIYKQFDETYPSEDEHARYLSYVLDKLPSLGELSGSGVIKPFVLASLCQALVHLKFKIEAFEPLFPFAKSIDVDLASKLEVLSNLSEALEEKSKNEPFAAFVKASTEGTNVKAAREVRFTEFCKMLS